MPATTGERVTDPGYNDHVIARLAWIIACCAGTAGCLLAPSPPGATADDASGPDGGTNGVTQVAYIKAGAAGAGDQAGYAVALSGDGLTLAVGVPQEDGAAQTIDGTVDDGAANAGAVYVYVFADGRWVQQAYIKGGAAVTGDRLGESVALSVDGTTLAVGAPGNTGEAGAAYVFTRLGTTWSEQSRLVAVTRDPGDRFGASVALSSNGSRLVVGAPGEDSGSASPTNNSLADAGAAYVFDRLGAEWGVPKYLKAPQITASAEFGIAIALAGDGTTLAVGAIGDESSTIPRRGTVVMFTADDAWVMQTPLPGFASQVNSEVGNAVALSGSGSVALTGAVGDASSATGIDGDEGTTLLRSGAAYLHERASTTWTKAAYVKASNTGQNDQFGASVALSRDASTFVVGAPFESSSATGVGGPQDNDDAATAGAAYLFSATLPRQQRAYIKASNTRSGDYFGFAVAISDDGGTIAVGAPREDGASSGVDGDQAPGLDNSGAVYVFR